MFKNLIFGMCRTGKTDLMLRKTAQSSAAGRRVIYLGRDSDLPLFEGTLTGTPGLTRVGSRDLMRCFNPGTGLRSEIIASQAILVGTDFFNDDVPARFTLLSLLLDMVRHQEITGEGAPYDVFIDDAAYWVGERLFLLDAGSLHFAYQSLSQLDQLIGERKANLLVSQFETVTFFRCADERTATKGAELLSPVRSVQKDTKQKILCLKVNESMEVHPTVPSNNNVSKEI